MTTAAHAAPALSTLNRTGLVLAFLVGAVDLASPLQPTPDGETGPPYAVLLLDSVLGLITVVAVVVAWRTTRRGAVRLVAGARIISMITALPAFFVDVPPLVKVLTGVFVILTIAIVAMMLAPTRRTTPVTD